VYADAAGCGNAPLPADFDDKAIPPPSEKKMSP
jgi:hypothetical protein